MGRMPLENTEQKYQLEIVIQYFYSTLVRNYMLLHIYICLYAFICLEITYIHRDKSLTEKFVPFNNNNNNNNGYF